MGKIQGTDLALLSARLGVYRLGAGRLGFYPWDVKGATNDEPGEYIWDEVKPPTTQWQLAECSEGYVCGFRPKAAFTDLPDPSDEGETVQFTDLSTPTDDITAWAWDFGDGNTSTLQNPTHVYATAGVYFVMLTVTSDKGTDTATGSHTVNAVVVNQVTGICYINGNPTADCDVSITVDAVPAGTTTSDVNGVYLFTPVTPGAIIVTADGTDVWQGFSGNNSDTLVSGTLTLDITLTAV